MEADEIDYIVCATMTPDHYFPGTGTLLQWYPRTIEAWRLSHPHDGSYGVDKCPEGHPDAGKWKCYWMGLGWMYDISAAPTTYAMSYRPYEVEDQDNLQRAHVAEYLVAAQDALRDRLKKQVNAGRTTPTRAWRSDYAEMKEWRDRAGKLFRNPALAATSRRLAWPKADASTI